MSNSPVSIAEAYYSAVGRKSIAEIEKHLHPDVCLVGPLASISGKQAVLEATRNFAGMFNALTIRAKFGSEDQAMIVYEVEMAGPIGTTPSASLMTFQNGMITKIQLFYDARPFVMKKEEIFTSKS